MSSGAEPRSRERRRRADAERSIAAILDAAVRVLADRPDAGVGDIAEAAGVTRQTVYAHYSSREALIGAVVDRVTEEVVAAIDAAELDKGTPVEALLRWLDAGWLSVERYPFLARIQPMSPQESHERHGPIFDRLERLIRRGQDAGDFERTLSPNWLLVATIGLAHTAAEEVSAGRMTSDDATAALHDSILRMYGAHDGPPGLALMAPERPTGETALRATGG